MKLSAPDPLLVKRRKPTLSRRLSSPSGVIPPFSTPTRDTPPTTIPPPGGTSSRKSNQVSLPGTSRGGSGSRRSRRTPAGKSILKLAPKTSATPVTTSSTTTTSQPDSAPRRATTSPSVGTASGTKVMQLTPSPEIFESSLAARAEDQQQQEDLKETSPRRHFPNPERDERRAGRFLTSVSRAIQGSLSTLGAGETAGQFFARISSRSASVQWPQTPELVRIARSSPSIWQSSVVVDADPPFRIRIHGVEADQTERRRRPRANSSPSISLSHRSRRSPRRPPRRCPGARRSRTGIRSRCRAKNVVVDMLPPRWPGRSRPSRSSVAR